MQLKNAEITVFQGDITELRVDAIVNAANNHFFMGGGVAKAIKQKGGVTIEEEAVRQGPVAIGESRLTGGGKLPARFVIHAVTMGMDFRTSELFIRQAASSALRCAHAHNICSLAFCALGCGVGGFSYKDSAKIIAQEIYRYFLTERSPVLQKIILVLFSPEAFQDFRKYGEGYLQYMKEKMAQGPFVTVDGIVLYQDGIVLIERLNPPLGWALPGGFVDYGESVEDAVIREIKEETNLDFYDYKQFRVFSSPKRDPRFHTISVVFSGQAKGCLSAASDARSAKVFPYHNLPDAIAFDHKEIIEAYKTSIGIP